MEIPTILWFDFESKRIGNVSRSTYFKHMKEENIPIHLVPVVKTSIIEYGRNEIYMITRKQFPITPAEAKTVHKSQGCTCDEVFVDLADSKFLKTSMVYVAYSRVTSLKGLYIAEKLTIPSFKINDAQKEIEDMRESRQLELSFTKQINGDLRIIYQNINSLPNKMKLITCDKWYLQATVLIFAETYTKEKHSELNIPGYTAKYRRDSSSNQSGIICYFQNETYNRNENVQVTCSIEFGGGKNAKFHIILLHFKIENTHVISGYKSPRTPFNIFRAQLEKLVDESEILMDDQFVLLGDFNFDTKESDSPLEKYLHRKFGLVKGLKNQSTTNNDSQIDTIFLKNIREHHSDVYETYFSDHKPIFVGFPSIGNEPYIQCENYSRGNTQCNRVLDSRAKKQTEAESFMSENFINLDEYPEVATKRGNVKEKRKQRKRKMDNCDKRQTKIKKMTTNNGAGENVIDLDEFPEMIPRSNEEIERELMDRIKNEIKTDGMYLTDISMNHISKIINNYTQEYNFQDVLVLAEIPEEIQPVIGTNDIQFLFEKPMLIIPCLIHNSDVNNQMSDMECSDECEDDIDMEYASNVECTLISEDEDEDEIGYASNAECSPNSEDEDEAELECTCGGIGHWICANFRHHENRVFIYDSFNRHELSAHHQSVLEKLYPTINVATDVIFKQLRYNQRSGTECGVFAATNAITLMLGRDPSTINFKISDERNKEAKYLRGQLFKMVEQNQILALPEQN